MGQQHDYDPEEINREFMEKLTADLKKSATLLSKDSARWLVDAYYQIQDMRIRFAGQQRSMGETGEPHELVEWLMNNVKVLEARLNTSLGIFAKQYTVGIWLQSITGIGPVLSAGLLTMFDIRRARTCSGFWRFAGCDPTVEWLGRAKATALVNEVCDSSKFTERDLLAVSRKVNRHPETIRRGMREMTKKEAISYLAKPPFSQFVKMFCLGRLGSSLLRQKFRESDFYGAHYDDYRYRLEQRNIAGEFRQYAKERASTVGKSTEAYKAYIEGMLPKNQVHRRSNRFMVKLFLSHLYEVMYIDYHGESPEMPYIIGKDGHTHKIDPPGWPVETKGKSLRELK